MFRAHASYVSQRNPVLTRCLNEDQIPVQHIIPLVVTEYLDNCICYCKVKAREAAVAEEVVAWGHYVDAYRTVRETLCGSRVGDGEEGE